MARAAKVPWDLLAGLALLLAADALVLRGVTAPWAVVVILLGLLLAPGHALASALFPERRRRLEFEVGEEDDARRRLERQGVDGAERWGLAFGLSVALIPLAGLVLSLTPWGVGVPQALVALTATALLASVAAAWRRHRAPPERAFAPTLPRPFQGWRAASTVDRILVVAVALSLVVLGGALAYKSSLPREVQPFTELYLLDAAGGVEFPQPVAGALVTYRVGVENHEARDLRYNVRAELVGGAWRGEGSERAFAAGRETPLDAWIVSLRPGERDVRNVTFTAPSPGDYRVQVELRLGDDPEPYRLAHLFVTVRSRG